MCVIVVVMLLLFYYDHWYTYLYYYDVNRQVDILSSVLKKSIDATASLEIKIVGRSPAPWVNVNIKSALHDRNNTYKSLRTNRTYINLHAEYKQKREMLKH